MASQPPTYLIDTLYYNLAAPYSNLVLIPKLPGDTAFCGINIVPLTNSAFEPTPPNNISFNSYRLPSNAEDDFTIGQYLQQLTLIQTVSGNMTMTSLYDDPGTTELSTVSGCTYLVLNGNGRYANAQMAYFAYNNQTRTRTVSVYGQI